MNNNEQKRLELRVELALYQMPVGLPLMTYGSVVERVERNRYRVNNVTAWTIDSAVRMIVARRG